MPEILNPLSAVNKALVVPETDLSVESPALAGILEQARRLYDPQSKVVLVGEANPYGGDPDYALYPSPERSAGYRLCVLILGMRRRDYLRSFERVNLCAEHLNMKEARVKADELTVEGTRLVLLGSKVCAVFGVKFTPFERARGYPYESGALVLPHPSGLCRLWNEPGNTDRTRTAVKEFLPHLARLIGTVDGANDGASEEAGIPWHSLSAMVGPREDEE